MLSLSFYSCFKWKQANHDDWYQFISCQNFSSYPNFSVSSQAEANKGHVQRNSCDILQTATTNPTISAAYDDRLW